jgi:hypothetical protein
VASISNTAGSNGLGAGLTTGLTTISATSGGITGSTALQVTPATLVSIGVTPTTPTIPAGTTRQFAATGTYTDGSSQDLTTTATWTSSNEPIATVSTAAGSQGLATGVAQGSATITATVGSVSGGTTLTVNPATLVSITVTPPNSSVPQGTNVQFTATGNYTSGPPQDLTTQATWGSSTGGVSISNTAGSRGLASTLGQGASTITATVGSITGSTLLSVTPATLTSIAVTPTNPSIAKGTTIQFTATGTYTDQTTQNLTSQVAWSSSDGTQASVGNGASSHGFATGLLAGDPVITATLGAIAGSTTLTVTDAVLVSIAVTPFNPSIANGTTRQFVATGTYTDGSTQNLTTTATWASTNVAVATVDNSASAKGLATGASVGQVTVSATQGSITGSTSLTVTAATLVSIAVTPDTPSIANGSTLQFVATGTYTSGPPQILTAQATWASLTPSVAVISNAAASRGLATSISEGVTTIRATVGGVIGTTQLTISGATLDTITITPGDSTIANGTTRSFHATGNYSDGSSQDLTATVTWTSGTPGVATISNSAGSAGLATSVTVGGTLITAALATGSGTVSNSIFLTVSNATLVSIALLPQNRSVTTGTNVQYTAVGTYTTGPTQDITTQVVWSTVNGAVALISNAASSEGLATAVGAGTTAVQATLSGITGSTNLTVASP